MTDVLTGVRYVAALAVAGGRLYWADGLQMSIRSALLDASGRVVAASVAQSVDLVAMPSVLAFPPGATSPLYYVDQARPASLLRATSDGNATQLVVQYGLSRPRGIAVAPSAGLLLLVDEGTAKVMAIPTGEANPTVVELYHWEDAFSPRGIAIRQDVSVRLPSLVGTGTNGDTSPNEVLTGAARRGSRGGRGTSSTSAAAAAVATGMAVAAVASATSWRQRAQR